MRINFLFCWNSSLVVTAKLRFGLEDSVAVEYRSGEVVKGGVMFLKVMVCLL